MHPAKEESPDWTEAPAQIGILSAGFGKQRTQFREGEGAEEGENCADDPSRENYRDKASLAGHFGWLKKNTGADHGADDYRAGCPSTKSTDKIEALLRRACGQDFSGGHDFPFWAALSC